MKSSSIHCTNNRHKTAETGGSHGGNFWNDAVQMGWYEPAVHLQDGNVGTYPNASQALGQKT